MMDELLFETKYANNSEYDIIIERDKKEHKIAKRQQKNYEEVEFGYHIVDNMFNKKEL